MKRSTVNFIIVLVGVLLCALLITGLLAGLSSGSSALAGSLGCDHIKTTMKYDARGSSGHTCFEVCEDCDKSVAEVNEAHETYVVSIEPTTVSGKGATLHDVTFECKNCHYRYKDYQNHVYIGDSSVCRGCGSVCQHPGMLTTPSSDGKIYCPVCPYWEDPSSTCEHKWENSVCENCGMTCTHTSGLGYDNMAEEPYYFCYVCDYVRVGSQ